MWFVFTNLIINVAAQWNKHTQLKIIFGNTCQLSHQQHNWSHTQRDTHTPLFLFKVSWLYDRLKKAWELLAKACDAAILCALWMDRLAKCKCEITTRSHVLLEGGPNRAEWEGREEETQSGGIEVEIYVIAGRAETLWNTIFPSASSQEFFHWK